MSVKDVLKTKQQELQQVNVSKQHLFTMPTTNLFGQGTIQQVGK